MQDLNGDDGDSLCGKGFVDDFMGDHRRYSRVFYFLKYVGKFTLDLIEDFFGPIDWHVFFLKKIIKIMIFQILVFLLRTEL